MAESKTAHTEAPASGHKGPFPPFAGETFVSQLIWLAITFVALYVIMSKVALPRVNAILEARRQRIADDLVEADRLKRETEAAIAAYEKKLAEARANAHAIAAKARDELRVKAEERRKVTEEQLRERLEEAEKTIAATKDAAMANVRMIAIEATAAIVQRLIGLAPSEKSVTEAVADALKR
jgi:F-type H+-transporting ATPase subunit b